MNGIWSEFAEEGLNETDNMITAPAVDIDDINLNGIDGVVDIIEMIKDTIDTGTPAEAKDWLNQLQEHFNEVL